MQNFNPSNPEYKKVDDLPKEDQTSLQQKRTAYIQAVEGRDNKIIGSIKGIINTMMGGKMSKDGELRMILDAEAEKHLRELAENDVQYTDYLDKYKKSYLKCEYSRFKNAEILSGVINGQSVEIFFRTTDENRNAIFKGWGKINGVEISEKDASEIFFGYKRIAEHQGDNIESFKNQEAMRKEHEKSLLKQQDLQRAEAEYDLKQESLKNDSDAIKQIKKL